MKIAFVVQRYGPEATGGAELHCRWLAERLARTHEVEVLTTCAMDYLRWTNHYPAGRDRVGPLPVTRYPVKRERNQRLFAFLSDAVFRDAHTTADEIGWVEENGPFCPALVDALAQRTDVDLFLFYSYRYYHAYFGLPRVEQRAVLVPTAEDDPALRLGIFPDLFRRPRGILYLTPEEQALVETATGNQAVPSAVIGVGIDVGRLEAAPDLLRRFELPAEFVLYVGRIDRNKSVDRLIAYYRKLSETWPELPTLVLAGNAVIDVPTHPKLRAVGFVSEEEKHALIAACRLLVMPSALESLSMVVLEAWALGRPVLVNAECKVLEGQCVRSGGGLFYRGSTEFDPALRYLMERPALRAQLGEAGRAYVQGEYSWEVVERRTNELLERVARSDTRLANR